MRYVVLVMFLVGSGCNRAPQIAKSPASPDLLPRVAPPRESIADVPGVTNEDYYGAVDLKWEMQPVDVERALKARAKVSARLATDKTGYRFEQFLGGFSGYDNALIEADFLDDGLNAISVQLPSKDERPAWRRWRDLVSQMREAHGPPDAEQSSLEIPENSDELVDHYIATGKLSPHAIWRFRNGAQVVITVVVGDPDRAGRRSLTPAWFAVANTTSLMQLRGSKSDM